MLRICAPATLVIAIVLLAPAGAAAQAAAAEQPASTEQPAAEATPRTPWGDPDLGGIWDFRTITPLERPEQYGDRAFLTQEEAVTLEQGAAQTDREANEAPAERTEAGGNIGAYNRFWFDFGTSVVADRRTSLIVDPPNGRRPPRTPEGEQRPAFGGSFGGGPFEQVEDLNYFDRCLGTAALPIFPTAYNNNVQVFQTPDHVALLVEMMGSTRIIPIDDRSHGNLRQWLGDSRGRWEGDTLVVETTRFDRDLLIIGGSRDAERLVERFTRVGPGILQYEYTVEDSTVWTQPWTAVQTFRKSDAPLFEYACHEGNYAATNILAGARAAEAAAAEAEAAR